MTETDVVGSHFKAKNGYGQNGYSGPSSDLPGQKTRTDRDYGLAADPSAAPGDWQTRKVDAKPYATAHGLKSQNAPQTFPTANVHKAHASVNPKSFQR